jgi:hypothetical protein
MLIKIGLKRKTDWEATSQGFAAAIFQGGTTQIMWDGRVLYKYSERTSAIGYEQRVVLVGSWE